jgi:hypothetical protein
MVILARNAQTQIARHAVALIIVQPAKHFMELKLMELVQNAPQGTPYIMEYVLLTAQSLIVLNALSPISVQVA